MKILIAYATRFGATEKCANMLSEMLRKKDFEVELVNLKDNIKVNPKGYDFVAIGGSFVVAKMNGFVLKFIKRNLNTLLDKKTGIFLCGSEESWESEMEKNFPVELLKSSVVKSYFGYEMNWDKMNPFFRKMMQKASNTTEPVSKIYTENIENFAREIEKTSF